MMVRYQVIGEVPMLVHYIKAVAEQMWKTSQICKLFESLIQDVLVNHLEYNQSIVDSQHGFIKGRSCLPNLLTFLEQVTSFADNGDNVDVIFLDFAGFWQGSASKIT